MGKRRSVVAVRVDSEQLRRIDALVASMAERGADPMGRRVGRADVLRLLLNYGLPIVEQIERVPAAEADPK